MKIMCIASSQPGHMDFGERGFVRIAKELQRFGNEVSWLTFGAQVERLQQVGFETESQVILNQLQLFPYFKGENIDAYLEQHRSRLQSLREFRALLARKRPNLLIIDRLFAYAGLVAEQLDIPYIAMGTPGGYWYFENSNSSTIVYPTSDPANDIRVYSQYLVEDLGWKEGTIDSCWLHSPSLNICFMAQSFYPINDIQKKLCANVFHHKGGTNKYSKKQIGISFGNQGEETILMKCLEIVVELPGVPHPVDVFVGNNDRVYQILDNNYTFDRIRLHRWVDFGQYFSSLSCLIFFGGIGTIWQCVNNWLPMLVIPGNVGDQCFNANRIKEIGLGIHLKESDIKKEIISEAIAQCSSNDNYRNRINEFRKKKNYSDTLESICERIACI